MMMYYVLLCIYVHCLLWNMCVFFPNKAYLFILENIFGNHRLWKSYCNFIIDRFGIITFPMFSAWWTFRGGLISESFFIIKKMCKIINLSISLWYEKMLRLVIWHIFLRMESNWFFILRLSPFYLYTVYITFM